MCGEQKQYEEVAGEPYDPPSSSSGKKGKGGGGGGGKKGAAAAAKAQSSNQDEDGVMVSTSEWVGCVRKAAGGGWMLTGGGWAQMSELRERGGGGRQGYVCVQAEGEACADSRVPSTVSLCVACVQRTRRAWSLRLVTSTIPRSDGRQGR